MSNVLLHFKLMLKKNKCCYLQIATNRGLFKFCCNVV